ncbi:histidinol dehydrogenase [Candidatus Bathyarchaeota archaeon]|nr:histidinol dehydrogenase [Candidatus Bathyarchaeota archaeon]
MSRKVKIKIVEGSSLPLEILNKRWPCTGGLDEKLVKSVERIIRDVKLRGDSALIELEEKFDGVKLSSGRLRVNQDDIEKAYEKVSDRLISAIEYSKSRVEAFQKEILNHLRFTYEEKGLRIRSCISPIRRVGCYVPGGAAPYPSTLVMTVTPAKVAGVKEIVVASPPRCRGEINHSILVAADICGVDEIYRIGGVQAIAALAYGTQSVRPVEKIVGPGNKYVQTAKILISKDRPIDFPAGPSEIFVIADDSADPRLIALDMISQAEHVDASSILVTTSRRLAERVINVLEEISESAPNKEMVCENLSKNGLVLICGNLEEAIKIANEFAPEHIEIMTEDAWETAERVTSAGLVLVKENTPVAASDYCLGTIHVLPTGGFSHVYSGLSVLDFVKHFCIVEASKSRLVEDWRRVKALAESEGLINHILAVEERFADEA